MVKDFCQLGVQCDPGPTEVCVSAPIDFNGASISCLLLVGDKLEHPNSESMRCAQTCEFLLLKFCLSPVIAWC